VAERQIYEPSRAGGEPARPAVSRWCAPGTPPPAANDNSPPLLLRLRRAVVFLLLLPLPAIVLAWLLWTGLLR
jgi:hypothetical protein